MVRLACDSQRFSGTIKSASCGMLDVRSESLQVDCGESRLYGLHGMETHTIANRAVGCFYYKTVWLVFNSPNVMQHVRNLLGMRIPRLSATRRAGKLLNEGGFTIPFISIYFTSIPAVCSRRKRT